VEKKIIVRGDPNGTVGLKKDTALHIAAEEGNLSICQLLVAKDATVDAFNAFNETPLRYAVNGNQLDVAEYLLEKGAEVNKKDKNHYRTSLHVAAMKGYLNMCKLLVSQGASIDALDLFNNTPLCFALSRKQSEVARYLLDIGANPSVLHAPARDGDLRVCQKLLANGATIDALDSQNRTALWYAVKSGESSSTKYLLDNGANPNVRGGHLQNTILHAAVEENDLNMCQILVAMGANIDALDLQNGTPLMYAVKYNRSDVARYLLENGANPNTKGGILHQAANQGNVGLCQLLVSKGADIHTFNSNNETALMIALNKIFLSNMYCQRDLAIVEYFLKNKAVYKSTIKKDVKDKYVAIFKKILTKWYPTIYKLAYNGSLKSICRDVIWKNIGNVELSFFLNGFNIPECLKKYIIFTEELRHVSQDRFSQDLSEKIFNLFTHC